MKAHPHVHEHPPAAATEELPYGVYGAEYNAGRKTKRQLIYRLSRRTDEVERAIRRYSKTGPKRIVDVGTADGLMLDLLAQRMEGLECVGLDYSRSLLVTNPSKVALKVQADAQAIPVRSGAADVVVATAVIEHVPHPQQLVREARRVLRRDGIFVLTTPDPKMEQIASKIGLLKDAGHHKTFVLRELEELVGSNGFEVVLAQKFMFSPVGFPFELPIERALRGMRMNFILANQLVVARASEVA